MQATHALEVEPKRRLETRITADLHEEVKKAAAIQGSTVTAFVAKAIEDAARQTIEHAHILQLSLADQNAFAEALITPPEPNEALKKAFSRSKKILKISTDA